MTEDETTTVIVGATRYYLGRMTYAVKEYCDILIAQWPNLSERCRLVTQRDVEEAFDRDDRARAFLKTREDGTQHGYLPLGLDTDRAQWEKVRRLWETN